MFNFCSYFWKDQCAVLHQHQQSGRQAAAAPRHVFCVQLVITDASASADGTACCAATLVPLFSSLKPGSVTYFNLHMLRLSPNTSVVRTLCAVCMGAHVLHESTVSIRSREQSNSKHVPNSNARHASTMFISNCKLHHV
jgi:hypothetical protein